MPAEPEGDRDTIAVYERRAAEWTSRRQPSRIEQARALARRIEAARGDDRSADDHPVLDLGCGPGWYAPALGPDVVTLDAARSMLDLATGEAPHAWPVQADLARLPFARGSAAGAWASNSYVHLARSSVPLALADLHRVLRPGAPIHLGLFVGDAELAVDADDTFAGRRFSGWSPSHLADVVVGAGFTIDALDAPSPERAGSQVTVAATRARTLPDTVGPGMRLLVCGLNPSVLSADVGVGFARNGNRYWPAALAAGIVSVDRDTRHAIVHHGVGMTDLVKRATPRADELTTDEYRAGLERVARLCAWLRPGAVCFVGLAGWRAAADRKAVAGVQPEALGGTPVYVMPSTSGLNARTTPAELADHLRAAAALSDSP
ncbi:MAG: methyltransferase domain-containing protein [Acidimicrobiales bacterium]